MRFCFGEFMVASIDVSQPKYIPNFYSQCSKESNGTTVS